MRTNHALLLFLAGIWLYACGPASPGTSSETTPVSDSLSAPSIQTPPHSQIVIVTTAGWDSVGGTLHAFDWQGDHWELALQPIPIVVGKNGLAWGRGTEDFTDRQGPVKREGDKRSPAGMFELGTAFGYAPAEEAAWIKSPYVPVIGSTMCIEDVASTHYNQILDEGATEADWNSTDHMLRKDDLYEWGMFVKHNASPPTPGGGSCIFLHVWRENDLGTAGCTAMDKSRIKDLLAWLDPEASPLLIQLPRAEYAPFLQTYNLPQLP